MVPRAGIAERMRSGHAESFYLKACFQQYSQPRILSLIAVILQVSENKLKTE